MDKAEALKTLGLQGSPSPEAVQAALAERKAELERKKAEAPTEALKAKFDTLLAQLDAAAEALASDAPGAPATAGPSQPSPLSQTKLADLPQAARSHTSMASGAEAGAQIGLQAGQLLAGRYEIKGQIGAGGIGTVYDAFDRTKQEDIALKVMLPSLMQNERARQRFLDEARISARLSHPHIVNVHDVQQDGDFFFLTMELLEGQNLRQLMEARQLSRQPFDEQEARRLATTVTTALAYAHQHTIHRDIKPENIWVTEEGDYKLMDFGIARIQSTSQRTQTGAARGTAYYMAPEQLKGTSSIDGRADQYALGVLLYELLTGDVPAGRFKPLRELRKDIGRGFAATVEKALETRPEDRFADMAAFASAIQSGKGGVSLPSLPWKGVGLAAVILLALAGLAAAVGSGSFDFSSLMPMSAEQKAQAEGQLARLQGEIRVLKQRLETARRNLDSRLRDAERSNSDQLAALRRWHTTTENAIFNGRIIGELEGWLSMAEVLQKQGQYAPAEEAFTEVRFDYEKLNTEFQAGEQLHAADREAQAAKASWQSYARRHEFTGQSPSAERAQQHYNQAQGNSHAGKLQTALTNYQAAANRWRNAQRDDVVQAQVQKFQAAQAAAEAERQRRAAAEAERKRRAAAAEAERQRRAAAAAEAERKRKAAIVAGFSLVNIPAGRFRMGGTEYGNEKPIRTVNIKAFRMMAHEVTFAQWDACVADGGCKHKPDDAGWGRGNRPVMRVSWNDITQQFIPWLNQATGQRFRLPSEAEWEYAARAGSTTEYSWGDSISCSRARYGRRANGECSNSGGTVPVKSFAPNAFGLYDMHGNVWEWVQDCWNGDYQGAPTDGSASTRGDCSNRVLRGGSWSFEPNYLRSAVRFGYPASDPNDNVGFRLVQDR